MLVITDGVVRDSRVKLDLCAPLDHGQLGKIVAIVVHQTDSLSAKGTIAGYKTGIRPDGAHFLIDKDGTIYQTVAVTRKCWHVGQIHSRCMQEHTCVPKEKEKYDNYKKQKGWTYQKNQEYHDERIFKSYPDRYPLNEDSIGIEIVSKAPDQHHFEKVTELQQRSLDWLVPQLLESLHLTRKDIFTHTQISYKNEEEGVSAKF